MRAGGIGLVGLLITFAIIMYLMGGKGCTGQSYLQTMMNVKKEKEPWAQQVGGKDVRGRPFSESLTVESWPESGNMRGLEVKTVDPAGPAATHFGLQVGDVILEIGMQDVGGPIIDSVGAGNDFLTEAFAKSFPITVRRAGEEMSLPSAAAPAGAAPANNAGGLPPLPGGLTPGGQ